MPWNISAGGTDLSVCDRHKEVASLLVWHCGEELGELKRGMVANTCTQEEQEVEEELQLCGVKCRASQQARGAHS